MFTKKPERETSDAPQKLTERMASESTTPFAERPASYARSTRETKLVPSIIGEDLVITGNVVSKGEIQVDGTIKGDVQCGSLLLGDKSEVAGSVVAEDIVVRGKVLGSVRGLRVTLQAQSHVEGDIYHQSLAIEQGAYFEGKSRRSDDPMSEGKTAASPSASAAAAPERPRMEPRPHTSFEARVERTMEPMQEPGGPQSPSRAAE